MLMKDKFMQMHRLSPFIEKMWAYQQKDREENGLWQIY